MKNKAIPILACLSMMGLALLTGAPKAEAINFKSPPFSSRPVTTYVYVDAKADGGSLDVSGTFYTRADGISTYPKARVRVTDPTGKQVWEFLKDMPSGSNSRKLAFSKLALASTTAGVWTIETAGVDASGNATGNGGIIPFHVAPCAEANRDTSKPCTSPLKGRVWWEKLLLDQQAYTGVSGSQDAVDFSLWTLSPWGVKHKITQYGYQGVSSSVQVNNLGLVDSKCEPVYHSDNMRVGTAVKAASGVAGCTGKFYAYRLFSERPDATMPEKALRKGKEVWVMPKYQKLTSSISYTPDQENSPYYKGSIKVTVGHQPGYLKLELDYNGDDKFDAVLAEEHVKPGTYTYPWDGKNAAGKQIDRYQRVKMRVTFTGVGEVHWVLDDAESRLGGIGVERLNGEPYSSGSKPAQADVVSWDDAWIQAKDGGKCRWLTADNAATASKKYDCNGALPKIMKADALPSTQAKTSHGWGDLKSEKTWGDGRYIEDWQLTSQIVHDSLLELSTDERASLKVTKDDGVEEVNPADTLTYQLRITNTHPWMFESAARLKDWIPPFTTFVSASDNGTYDEATRTVSWPEFPLLGGETAERMVTVTVDDDVPPGSEVTNYVTVSGEDSKQKATDDPETECVEPLCDRDTDTVPVPPPPTEEPEETPTPTPEPTPSEEPEVPLTEPENTPSPEVVPVEDHHPQPPAHAVTQPKLRVDTGGQLVAANWPFVWGTCGAALLMAGAALVAAKTMRSKRS